MTKTDGPLDDGDLIRTAGNRLARRLPRLWVRGLDEAEILAMAPASICDRVHWDTLEEFDARRVVPHLSQAGLDARTRQWSDGQHRVWVPEGQGHHARNLVRQWCAAQGVDAVNLRVEPRVLFSDVEQIPDGLLQELLASAADWLYPRIPVIRARLVAEIDGVDETDVRSMLYLFVSDHIDRYDAEREGRNGQVNLLTYLLGKVRTWPQDAARAAYGRGVVDDRLTIRQVSGRLAATLGRTPTELELAEALGVTVTDLRRREAAVSLLAGTTNAARLDLSGDLDVIHGSVGGATEADQADASAIDHAHAALVTRAVLKGVTDPMGRRAQDPLALAAVYLAFWEGLSRSEVARELDVLPKTAAAAIARVTTRMAEADLR